MSTPSYPKRQRFLEDAALKRTAALPTGAATTHTTAYDLGEGEKFENVEIVVRVPALALTELPNAATLTVKVLHGDTSTPTTELATLGVVTGATGTDPSTAREFRFRYPSTVGQYLRVAFIGSSGVAAAAKQGEVTLVF